MGAEITSATPEPVYAQVGKNLAPSKPLKELSKNEQKSETFCDAILDKYQDYKERDSQARREWLEIGRMVANQRAGKLLMQRHPFDNRIIARKRDSRFNDAKTVGGKFQFYSTKLTAEWLSSRPERDPICPSDDDQIEEFIAGVKIVQDFYDTKFFNTQYETQESLSAQDYGTWITRYRFDPDTEEIVCELLDIPACQWDLRFKPEESSFFIYESKCATATLEYLFDIEFTEDGEDGEHWGLQLREQIARQGGNVKGWGQQRPYGASNDTPGETVVTEMWLQPEAYCDIVIDKPEKTVSGASISGRLIDFFPNGLVVVGVNGMKAILGLYAENLKDHIVSGYYHLQSFSGMGKGISDAVDAYKEVCDNRSQISAYIKAHGTPSWMYDQDLITEDAARNIGKPRKAIPIDMSGVDGVRNVGNAIQAITPGNPGNSMWGFSEVLDQDLQMAMQVTDYSQQATLGIQSDTATGDEIRNDNAKVVLVPQHLNKADHRRRSDVVIYNLFKKYVDKPKWFASKDLNGITKGKYLSGHDFDNVNIDFQVVSNSEVPKSPGQRRLALAGLFQQTGGVAGFLEAMAVQPDLMGEIADAFEVKLKIPTQKNIARVCRQRIERAKKKLEEELQNQQLMAAIGEIVGDPDMGADNANLAAAIVSQLVPPINPWEPYHPMKIEWLANLLDHDEMMYASDELRDVITEMIQMHLKQQTLAQAYAAQDQNMAALIAELPALVGEDIMNRQHQLLIERQAAEQAAAQQQQTLQLKAQEAEISEKQSEAEHKRQLVLSDKSHEQQLQLTAISELSKLEQARSKARTASK